MPSEEINQLRYRCSMLENEVSLLIERVDLVICALDKPVKDKTCDTCGDEYAYKEIGSCLDIECEHGLGRSDTDE